MPDLTELTPAAPHARRPGRHEGDRWTWGDPATASVTVDHRPPDGTWAAQVTVDGRALHTIPGGPARYRDQHPRDLAIDACREAMALLTTDPHLVTGPPTAAPTAYDLTPPEHADKAWAGHRFYDLRNLASAADNDRGPHERPTDEQHHALGAIVGFGGSFPRVDRGHPEWVDPVVRESVFAAGWVFVMKPGLYDLTRAGWAAWYARHDGGHWASRRSARRLPT